MSGRVTIVTGAASGIGKAIAETFAQNGDHVVLIDLPNSAGQEVATAMGGHFIAADLSQRSECRHLVDETISHYGKVDILVNNAGFQHIDAIEDFPEDTWDKLIAVMLTAPFLLTKYVFPTMKAQGWGRVVNVGSVHSLRASPFKVGYISAKHGLLGLTRTASVEGGPHGITVNTICPAYVRTPLVENQIADQARTRGISPEEVVEKVMLAPTSVKRLIEPAEIGSLVLYLCSEVAGGVNGSDWTIDLGWTAH
jgi:3-hydroxybutyrate dehydrogenase